jgi:hypothetical protein
MMWRQGDVMIQQCEEVPAEARRVKKPVVAEGEQTGHTHRVKEFGSAELYRFRDNLYLRVLSDQAEVVHPEHDTIALPRGTYRVWKQREFTESRPRRVMD